jgi:hypothetical protein
MRSLEKNMVLKTIFLLYIYTCILLYGWQIITFISIYHTMDQDLIRYNLILWSNWQIYFIVAGFFITGMFALSFLRNLSLFETFFKTSYTKLRLHLFFHIAFLVLLSTSYSLLFLDTHLNLLDLIGFFICIYLLNVIGNVFFQADRSAWMHPTTHGAIYISALLLGFACLLLINPLQVTLSKYVYWVLILLIFDLLIVYARFRYLSRHDRITNQIARKLMGPYLIYFGTRIIVGIFMPVLYLLYAIFFNPITLKGTGILIVIGTFLERMLFVFVGEDRR